MTMLKLTVVVLLATAAALIATDTKPSAAATLRIGLADDPDMLDPPLARTYTSRIVFAAMCDKLVDITPELDIAPQLATDWQWVDDNKGLVLGLRQGVKFQDGEPLDAEAVKYSIERHLNMPGSNRKSEISAVSAVDIIDSHTVKLVLKTPFAPLLAALSDRAGMIVSPKAANAVTLPLIRFAPGHTSMSSASDRTASCSSGSPIIGTRTRSSSTALCSCRSRTRRCASPICSRVDST